MQKIPIHELLARARARQQAGDLSGAEERYAALLQRLPDHPGAWLGRIDTVLAMGDPDRALALVDQARAKLPALHRVALLSKRVRALEAQGALEAALKQVGYLRAEAPEETGPALLEAGLLRRTGDLSGAEERYAALLQRLLDHAGVWLGRIDTALAMGDPDRALALVDQARAKLPALHRVALLSKRVRALEAQGALEAALKQVGYLRAEAPEETGPALLEAGLLRRTGDLSGAEERYAALLQRLPDHAGVWLGRIDTALAMGDPDRALALVDQARAKLPALHRVALLSKRVRALEAQGALEAALKQVGYLRAEAPEETGPALLEAGLLRRTGDLSGAEERYAALLQRLPDHAGAWLGRIDTALAMGDPDRALVLVDQARAMRPGDPAMDVRRAGLLRQMNRSEAAIALLAATLETHPDAPGLHHELARAQTQAGQHEAARAELAALLEADPEDHVARLALVQTADTPDAGLAGLAGYEERSPQLALKAAQLYQQAGKRARLNALLDRLVADAPGMTDPGLQQLFRLGEQADHVAAPAVIRTLAARSRISPGLAQFVMIRGRRVLEDAQAAQLQAALERRLPSSRRAEFRAFSAAFLVGPDEALAQARANLPSPRGVGAAALLGERLLDAGYARLGLRYLRACVRRWPNAPLLRRHFIRAVIETGALACGMDWLDTLAEQVPDADTGLDRLHLLIQQGRLQEARDGAGARQAAGLRTLSPRMFLDLALALGDLETSAEMARAVQAEPGTGRQNAAHFSTTLHGAQFNELRLYHAAQAHAEATGEDPDRARARLAQDFFFPAKAMVAERAVDFGPRPGARYEGPQAVSRRIFQYWNTATVPEEVSAVMQSWRSLPGFAHQLYDRRGALAFLREHFGPRHVRAFQLANSPAEECDFLRLCLLYKFGGIYVDADDKLVGDPEALLAEGPGLILSREPWGAIANNLICAPPGHALLLWALQRSGRSLLARENDGTWFKSGPGLMTRAVAVWLDETPPEQAARGLTILPLPQLRGIVQPHVRLGYKATGRYWNASDRRAAQPLVAALIALD